MCHFCRLPENARTGLEELVEDKKETNRGRRRKRLNDSTETDEILTSTTGPYYHPTAQQSVSNLQSRYSRKTKVRRTL